MNFNQVVLVVLIILFATAETFAMSPSQVKASTATSTTHRFIYANQHRMLRVDGSDEERGAIPGLSTIKAAVSNAASKTASKVSAAKIRWNVGNWAIEGKSEAYVKSKLGLSNLEGSALTSNKNYKAFERFVRLTKEYRANNWLTNNVNTEVVWYMLHLDTIAVAQRKSSDEYATFVAYVNKFDRKMMKYDQVSMPTTLKIGSTPDELMAKVEIWATEGRSETFVAGMLGLNHKFLLKSEPKSAVPYLKAFFELRNNAGKRN